MRHLVPILALLLAICPGLAAAASPGSVAGPPPRLVLWKATDKDSEVWLLGSIHALKASTRWRTAQVNRLIERAPVVYFETDVNGDAREAYAAVQSYSSDRRVIDLSFKLDRENWFKLAELVEENNLHLGQFYWIRPWYAHFLLHQAMSRHVKARANLGVDAIIEREASRAQKEIRYLETIEDQMRALSAASDEEAIELLVQFLDIADSFDPEAPFDQLVKSWQQGDVKGLAEQIERELGSETLYDALLVERNTRWVEQIRELMDNGSGMTLIVVGAGHLVGRGSVPVMLRAAGYEVTRH